MSPFLRLKVNYDVTEKCTYFLIAYFELHALFYHLRSSNATFKSPKISTLHLTVLIKVL